MAYVQIPLTSITFDSKAVPVGHLWVISLSSGNNTNRHSLSRSFLIKSLPSFHPRKPTSCWVCVVIGNKRWCQLWAACKANASLPDSGTLGYLKSICVWGWFNLVCLWDCCLHIPFLASCLCLDLHCPHCVGWKYSKKCRWKSFSFYSVRKSMAIASGYRVSDKDGRQLLLGGEENSFAPWSSLTNLRGKIFIVAELLCSYNVRMLIPVSGNSH